ncbi:long-chain acyl-CoA dehydrogenase [Hyphomonas polymorpha PS728]|uniref:Long-chain acyl-CoA dehydrogenase n=1 Tax=Hyphomonas polymorpha PS728 TaxID=1280954 RepID=A0A062VB57_9PROT|nr:acyl-CoA dehydrogenase family protein [Hyphomonas polymorpha]KCZ99632.1 long-chain acyl-CoA dehydrogenase [Hyphomonas polymorpha PS728]
MLDTSRRTVYNEEHEVFRDSVRKFYAKEIVPHLDRWEKAGLIEPAVMKKLGDAGFLCPTVPEAYGGLGLDFRYNAVVAEENSYVDSMVLVTLQSDVVVEYLVHYGSEEQKQKWLPRCVSGDTILAIAMTEPGAGSDLQSIRTSAVRDGDDYVINGAKTYISAGQNCTLAIVVAKTDMSAGARGISLFLVESDRPGFTRGRNLDKIGQNAADTSELFFENVRVPATNLLGQENMGFAYMMSQLPQERLSIAVSSQAMAQRAYDEAVRFTKERTAFGKKVFEFQNTRFTLADLKARLQVGWAHLDWALARHVRKQLTADEAAAAKLFHTELLWEVCDTSLQLHGGAGYMNEYPIARMWRDARVMRIFGGSSEIMKELMSRTI